MTPDRILREPQKESPRYAVEKIVIAGNRGPCGGVNMALEATNQVLEVVAGREPVYTNWPIVNNVPIMAELERKGLVCVNNNWDLVPSGSVVLFSAHGVPPKFREIAQERNYLVIDTTCQLVTRVHNLALKAQRDGLKVIYIGVNGHPETVGVLGELQPENSLLVEKTEDVEDLELGSGKGWIVFSQTTLMPDEVVEIEQKLAQTFPDVEIPNRLDLCYSTYNRQAAVEKLIDDGIDLLLVVGSKTSHNSQMLARKGESSMIPSYSVDYPWEIEDYWFDGIVKRVGITSGASVQDRFMMPIVEYIEAKSSSAEVIFDEQAVEEEDMTFKLPQKDIEFLKKRWVQAK